MTATTKGKVKERPILFSSPMVRAILSGAKSQTRRIVKPQPPAWVEQVGVDAFCGERQFAGRGTHPIDWRAEKLIDARFWHGDHLWVRETLHIDEEEDCTYVADGAKFEPLEMAARYGVKRVSFRCGKVSSIHMPRWASRVTLEVTAVRVERLNLISEADARAEGIAEVTKDGILKKYCVLDRSDYSSTPWQDMPRTAKEAYAALWDSINGPGAWALNPWVWVIAFKQLPNAELI